MASENTVRSEPASVQDDGASPSNGSRGISLWPGVIFVLLGGQLITMLIAVYLATSDRSFAVEPDYYQKALHWDDNTAQKQANAELGWSTDISLSDKTDIYKNRDLTLTLTDAAGERLDDVTIEMIAFSHARGNERFASALQPLGNGRYGTTIRMTRAGRWEFRIVAQRGDNTFTQTQELRITSVGEPRRWQR